MAWIRVCGCGTQRALQSGVNARKGSRLDASLWVRCYWYLFYKSTEPPVRPLASDGFSCRRATVYDVRHFAAFAPYQSASTLTRWATEPATWLVLAFDGNRPIAYDCVSRQLPSYPPFSGLTLGADEAWVRDEYTVPEYRRRRVMRTLKAYRNELLRKEGFAGTVSGVSEENTASLIQTDDGRVRKVAGLDYRRVLLWRRCAFQADARPRLDRLRELRGHLADSVHAPSHGAAGGSTIIARARAAMASAGRSAALASLSAFHAAIASSKRIAR